MGNPVFVDCPKDVWTKVATNVVTGMIWKVKNVNVYLQTFRVTGDPAPTSRSDGVAIFRDNEPDYEIISATSGIDIHIFPVGKNGRVRVDL